MRTWSLVGQKGGCGKSTVATSLGVRAEEAGEMVLILDLDPQLSATLWHSQRGTNKPLVLDAQVDKLPEVLQSAATLGVTLCLIDSPSKLDSTALAAIRVAEQIICPTLPDLFNLGSLQDTVRLLEGAEKLGAAVGLINNVDEAGAEPKIAQAREALASFNLAVCPDVIHHRPQFQNAIEQGKGVTELGARGKKAAEEIDALWQYLDRRAKQQSKKAKSRETAES
jgi:chromosome partitioning protein